MFIRCCQGGILRLFLTYGSSKFLAFRDKALLKMADKKIIKAAAKSGSNALPDGDLSTEESNFGERRTISIELIAFSCAKNSDRRTNN
jgi:hypothetical protein